MATKGKFDAPKLGDGVDQGKYKKLAQRVEEALTKESLFAEPKQIDPSLILVAPNNRDGAPPNVRHVHQGILKSFQVKGFDRTRPAIGICIKFTSEKGLKDLHEHNSRFSKGCTNLPPIKESACYGSLACSHLNLALRCIQANTSSPVGNLEDLTVDSPNLKEVSSSGHRWWVLPESLVKERQVDISLWRNMDQNEKQMSHEIEILQGIRATAEVLSKKRDTVKQGDLLSAAIRRNPAKVSPDSMMTLCKLYIGFLENGCVQLVQDLVDFHSDKVDPKELTVSISFIQSIVSEEALSKCPHTRLHLLELQYTLEKVRVQSSGPAVGSFLEPSNITNLSKKADLLEALEVKIRAIKSKFLPILESLMSDRQARLELSVYVDLILRCLFAKPWPMELRMDLPVGKYCQDKVEAIGIEWAL